MNPIRLTTVLRKKVGDILLAKVLRDGNLLIVCKDIQQRERAYGLKVIEQRRRFLSTSSLGILPVRHRQKGVSLTGVFLTATPVFPPYARVFCVQYLARWIPRPSRCWKHQLSARRVLLVSLYSSQPTGDGGCREQNETIIESC
uniref:Ribosomal protein L14 n=1 Tax=Knipowitschia caucasica TaxID=637954 RepID=A0AAV2LEX3_KNICA